MPVRRGRRCRNRRWSRGWQLRWIRSSHWQQHRFRLCCNMDTDIQHGHEHAEWALTWTCGIKMDIHGHGDEEWTWTCSMDLDTQHTVDLDTQYWPAHEVWTCSYSMDNYSHYGHEHASRTDHAHDMYMHMHHGHGHAPWTWKCTMDIDIHHGHGHPSWTWTCTMDLNMHRGSLNADEKFSLASLVWHLFMIQYLVKHQHSGIVVSLHSKNWSRVKLPTERRILGLNSAGNYLYCCEN